MNSLLTLAGTTSLLGGAGSTAAQQFEERIPGFGVLQNFLKTWFKVDLTTLLTIAAMMGAASSGAQSLRAGASKAYWWIIRFLTASISIAGHDRLNREVLNWLGANVLTKKGTRILTAHSERIQNDAWHFRRVQERNDYHHEKRVPVQYLPTFGTTWFIHERNVFMVRRILTGSSHYNSSWSNKTPDEYAGAPDGNEPLVVMCLGRSVEPIKRFLQACRDYADKQREAFVTVRASKGRNYDEQWDTTILRPLRPLETVHFDEKKKGELVADIINYLDPNTRKFYNRRGIPYRRGYLLHGPPGTGKTSLSLALAGRFGLELYLLHIPSVQDDKALEKLFTSLPPRCMVLLEDIDAVGVKSRTPKTLDDPDDDDDGDDSDTGFDRERKHGGTRCTLAGLLNVLDGVASQEGRIVLMTSNFADRLDKALVRPGRVDRTLFLGNISQRSSELMFLRMYSRNGDGPAPAESEKHTPVSDAELARLAIEFSKQIPNEVFTPAQVQGFLLNYRNFPTHAVASVGAWAAEEFRTMEEARVRDEKAAEKRRRRRKEMRQKMQAKAAAMARKNLPDLDSDLELGTLLQVNNFSELEEMMRNKMQQENQLKRLLAEKTNKLLQEKSVTAVSNGGKAGGVGGKTSGGTNSAVAGEVGVNGEVNGEVNGQANNEANNEANGNGANGHNALPNETKEEANFVEVDKTS